MSVVLSLRRADGLHRKVGVQDRDGTFGLLAALHEQFSRIAVVWADSGYAGRLVSWACSSCYPDLHATSLAELTDDEARFRGWELESVSWVPPAVHEVMLRRLPLRSRLCRRRSRGAGCRG